jgi:hypothetical protein
MRLTNDTPFVPNDVSQAQAQHGTGEGLRLFLHSACRNYGYRKLELDRLRFWHLKIPRDFRGEPFGTAPESPKPGMESRASLHANEGSLAVYECDV